MDRQFRVETDGPRIVKDQNYTNFTSEVLKFSSRERESNSSTSVLQTEILARASRHFERAERIELSQGRLEIFCLTIRLRPHWSRVSDSNRPVLPYHGRAIPRLLTRRKKLRTLKITSRTSSIVIGILTAMFESL